MKLRSILGAICSLPLLIHAAPGSTVNQARQSTDRLVFAHFMIGITSNRNSAADYDDDMKRAKSLGIDAFALNIGVDPYTDRQLDLAYQSAANNDMKVFISFDFNWYHTGQGYEVGQKVAQYGSRPAQLMVDGKIFVSSFAGDGLDINAMRSAAGKPVFFAPNFHPEMGTDMSGVDGLLNWMAWDNDGNNKAPKPGRHVTVQDGDDAYIRALNGKGYIAPVSPWFFTHFGPEVPYSKNWVFPGDLLWYDRWLQVLDMGPRFIEIVTWNDYGESHYIGPLSSPHTDDGASKWVNDMPHDGWMDMSKPFIAAYKDGASSSSVNSYITEDLLVYWYRPAPRGVNCDATDTCMVPANNGSGNYFNGRPDGWETMEDAVFVVTTLTEPATVTVNSGGNVQVFDAPAGASAFTVPMGVGSQAFSLSRNGQVIQSGVSLLPIIDGCVCGLYNFNPYVGTLPPGPIDSLQSAGLNSLTQGLHVQTCAPTPSLGNDYRYDHPHNQYQHQDHQNAHGTHDHQATANLHDPYNYTDQHEHQNHDNKNINHDDPHNHNHNHERPRHRPSLYRRNRPRKLRRAVQFRLPLWLLPSRPLQLHAVRSTSSHAADYRYEMLTAVRFG
ncbi:hypothetical protein ASPCAL13390 [Aspergillus calidoustus]|uniref:Alpha-1,3-glucanase/mutanase n=1 Tax=Aspergillus calidoustus TaxID=454130 RepID=A0A0U5CHI9_ASPCI|nr:hypothetical protein ASPCAL13390 [Aspergillus calidoustus]